MLSERGQWPPHVCSECSTAHVAHRPERWPALNESNSIQKGGGNYSSETQYSKRFFFFQATGMLQGIGDLRRHGGWMKYRMLGASCAGGKSAIKGVRGLLAKSEHGWRPGRRGGGRECSVSPGGCVMSQWAWVCCMLAELLPGGGQPCPAQVRTPCSPPLTPTSCLCPSQPSLARPLFSRSP